MKACALTGRICVWPYSTGRCPVLLLVRLSSPFGSPGRLRPTFFFYYPVTPSSMKGKLQCFQTPTSSPSLMKGWLAKQDGVVEKNLPSFSSGTMASFRTGLVIPIDIVTHYNPKGVFSYSPGLRVSALPWVGTDKCFQPQGGCLVPWTAPLMRQPRWGWYSICAHPRGSADTRNPGL